MSATKETVRALDNAWNATRRVGLAVERLRDNFALDGQRGLTVLEECEVLADKLMEKIEEARAMT